MIVDVIVDLQYGDCGKGKVAHHLCKPKKNSPPNYTHVVRYNGGCNAGHTIYHNGVKFVTHHIPAGVFFGIKSVIGPGCVLNIERFFEEIQMLKDGGISNVDSLVKVAKNTHIITPGHIWEDEFYETCDNRTEKLGTTKRGNGPAYASKYARRGERAEDYKELEPYLVDFYEEMHQRGVIALFEGAQGFGLDIDWGDYPYVTSSHCTVAGALLNGIPHTAIRDVWGVAKCYETYVGAKDFGGDDPIFEKICELGKEYGATTGRKRQINWMNTDLLLKAININGVNKLVINKMDILREVDAWKMYCEGHLLDLAYEKAFTEFLTNHIIRKPGINYYFSGDKNKI